jgi:hypothetical protein
MHLRSIILSLALGALPHVTVGQAGARPITIRASPSPTAYAISSAA